MDFDFNRDIQKLMADTEKFNWKSTGEDSAKPSGKSRSICRVARIV